MTDYKALYEAEVLKNKRLIQKCNTSILKRKEIEKKIPQLLEQERYREREANERDWNDKSEEQIEELQEKIKCLERLNMKTPTQGFRLAIEEENKQLKEEINGDGLLKQGYKTELSNSHKQQNRMVKEIVKLKKENEKLKAQQFEEEEEEVDTCAKCNRKKEGLSDMFITHDETASGGEKYMVCGMCSLNHFKALRESVR